MDHVGRREGVGKGVAAQVDVVIVAAVVAVAQKAQRSVEGVDLAVSSERG